MTFGYMEIVASHVALVERGRPPAEDKTSSQLSFSIYRLTFSISDFLPNVGTEMIVNVRDVDSELCQGIEILIPQMPATF